MPNIRYFFKINQSDHSFDEDVRIKVSVDGNVVLEDFTVTNKKPKTITVTADNINPGEHEVRLDLLNPKSSNTIDGEETSRYLIVHNIGSGQVAEDILFDNKIIGHYRFKE